MPLPLDIAIIDPDSAARGAALADEIVAAAHAGQHQCGVCGAWIEDGAAACDRPLCPEDGDER